MNIKRLAHKVYYCGHCCNSEEEEALLNHPKYGKVFKDRDYKKAPTKFDDTINTIIGPSFKNPLPLFTKDSGEQRLIEMIIDDLEDKFNLDIDNTDLDKFTKFNSHINAIKAYVSKRIKNTPLPDTHKKELIDDIMTKRDVPHLLHYLYLKAHPYF